MGPVEKQPAGKYSTLPGRLPPANIPADVDPVAVASACVERLDRVASGDDLADDVQWRDTYSFTGTLRTFYNLDAVTTTWAKLAKLHKPHNFKLNPKAVRRFDIGAPAQHSWIQAMFTFETEGALPATCSGFIGIIREDEGWKIWTLRTMLENFKGLENVDVPPVKAANGHLTNGHNQSDGVDAVNNVNAVNGVHSVNGVNGVSVNDVNGTSTDSSLDFDVVIVGGGQAGLGTAGRLSAMNVSYVVLEAGDEVGGSWLKRYDSARLHLPKDVSHLPFDRSFLEDDPELLGINDVAGAFKRYADKYAINIQLSTRVEGTSWDAKKKKWTVRATSPKGHKTFTANELVLANGLALSTPQIPALTDRDLFKGKVMHATQYKNADAWKGLKGIVVGTANTSHDIARDMVNAELGSVYMVQRSSTFVMPIEHIRTVFGPLWNANMPTGLSDRLSFTNSHSVLRLLRQGAVADITSRTAYYDAIRNNSKFRVTQYADINEHLYGNSKRMGGHYIDVGNIPNIVEGRVKVKSDSPLVGYTEKGLRFEDGEELEADVVVFATGFKNDVKEMVAKMCGQEVADQTEEYWGIDREGEIRGTYKPSGRKFFSLYLLLYLLFVRFWYE